MRARLAKFIENSWYSEGGPTLLLLPFAWLFAVVTGVRRWCYRSGIFSRPSLAVPVIVVGNLAVGGTGKSPIVGWLAQELKVAGYRPGIVSRGYGGIPQGSPVIVAADSSSRDYGDEPVMLAQQTGVPVCVCTDRVAAVMRLAAEGINVVVADDGLQHYRMNRIAEIVVVDGDRLFGNGRLMPAGPLREPLGRLAEADAVLVNGGKAAAGQVPFQLQALAAVALASPVGNPRQKPLSEFSGQRVWAVAGIGNPERFHTLLRSYGVQVDVVDVPDHGHVSLEAIVSRRSQPVLMTQKDAVKYSGNVPADTWYVPVTVQIDPADAQQLLGSLLGKLQPPLSTLS